MHHPIVEFENVSYTYGEGVVLDRISLTIPEGAFVGVVGPSGAGKTTMLKLISGTTKPYCRANFLRILAIREAISSRDAISAVLSSFERTSSISYALSCS